MNISIIDDDPIYQFTARKMLERLGIVNEITLYSDGDTALDALKQIDNPSVYPDIFFVDINMPVCGGWEFIERLREINQTGLNGSKIYVVSSSIDKEDEERAAKTEGVRGYIVKPLSKNLLLKLLTEG